MKLIELKESANTPTPDQQKFIDRWVGKNKWKIKNGVLHVGGELKLNETNISQLPDNFRVDRSLFLNETNISQLPDNLHVGKDLNLYGTKITQLPDNLYVGEHLLLNRTKITQLPDNLYVGGILDLRETKITNLHNTHKKIKHMTYLYCSPKVTHLMGVFFIKGCEEVHNNLESGRIINKHLKGGRDLRKCQEELIQAGFAEYAKL